MSTPELRGIRILAGMSDTQLASLGKYGEVVEYAPSESIIEQGEPSDGLFLVLEGKVGAYVTEPHGNEVHLRTIETGGHFGEIGLLEAGRRTATVRALTQSRLLSIDKKAFQELLKAPELAVPLLLGLSRSLAIRLTDLTNRVATLWALKDTWDT